MEKFQIILEMLNSNQQGVLVTLIDSSPAYREKIQERHGIWIKGQNPVERYNLHNLFPAEEEVDKLTELCLLAIKEKKLKREKIQINGEWADFIFEPIMANPRLIILGCGHVGQAVAKLAHMVQLPLIVIDDRPDFANQTLFPPDTKVICNDFTQALMEVQPRESDFVVIVTRGHAYDRVCLENLAERKLAYLGMIGSKRRVRELLNSLADEGVNQDWLQQIHTPIGLDIGAETPAEIGISIIAEIIQVWRKGARV